MTNEEEHIKLWGDRLKQREQDLLAEKKEFLIAEEFIKQHKFWCLQAQYMISVMHQNVGLPPINPDFVKCHPQNLWAGYINSWVKCFVSCKNGSTPCKLECKGHTSLRDIRFSP